jgi:hypothetical protein
MKTQPPSGGRGKEGRENKDSRGKGRPLEEKKCGLQQWLASKELEDHLVKIQEQGLHCPEDFLEFREEKYFERFVVGLGVNFLEEMKFKNLIKELHCEGNCSCNFCSQ